MVSLLLTAVKNQPAVGSLVCETASRIRESFWATFPLSTLSKAMTTNRLLYVSYTTLGSNKLLSGLSVEKKLERPWVFRFVPALMNHWIVQLMTLTTWLG